MANLVKRIHHITACASGAWENLGTSLLLPPWFEAQRDTIGKMLEPVTLPEENLPRSGR